MPLLIVIVILAIIAFYVIAVYNSLQTLKTQIVASIQEIGNQLKRQASLIPNLEAAVKGYLKHEKGIFEMLTAARTSAQKASASGESKDIEKAISNLQSVIPQIQVLVESNPELKSNESVNNFMRELGDTADKLMYARRSLIDLSQAYNEKLVVFPSNIIANMFGFKPEKGLDTALTGEHVSVSEAETKDVKVNL
ncbi:LemA family protein [Patescibacteria group bacterium]|nr:LemA family protein [Patescibacteria group bacterium]